MMHQYARRDQARCITAARIVMLRNLAPGWVLGDVVRKGAGWYSVAVKRE